jgi:hypothetical protein
MWGVFAGMSLWVAFYPMIHEWLEHRAHERQLAAMRKHVALGHRWDVLQGRWTDD